MTDYQAINNKVIVKRQAQKQLSSGIYIDTNKTELAVLELEVIATTDLTKELQGKTIMAERRHVQQLSEGDNTYIGSIKYEDILAIKHE